MKYANVVMRREFATRLVVLAVLVAAGGTCLRGDEPAKASATGRAIAEGAWRKLGNRNPQTGKIDPPPEGLETIKLIVGGRWVWTLTKDGRAIAGLGGTYTIKDDQYTERVEYAITDGFEAHIGRSFTFTSKYEGNTWNMKGTLVVRDMEFKIDEDWERVTPK